MNCTSCGFDKFEKTVVVDTVFHVCCKCRFINKFEPKTSLEIIKSMLSDGAYKGNAYTNIANDVSYLLSVIEQANTALESSKYFFKEILSKLNQSQDVKENELITDIIANRGIHEIEEALKAIREG